MDQLTDLMWSRLTLSDNVWILMAARLHKFSAGGGLIGQVICQTAASWMSRPLR